MQLTLSLGGGETRNVFAGIKAAYKPEDLVGRLVICVANLKPRQMKFGLSQGMICASGGWRRRRHRSLPALTRPGFQTRAPRSLTKPRPATPAFIRGNSCEFVVLKRGSALRTVSSSVHTPESISPEVKFLLGGDQL
ncbi:MAG UNVERIFIED_CONTAM: hypothetical protein LVR18_47940 [Planctomycetaceae bacterium]